MKSIKVSLFIFISSIIILLGCNQNNNSQASILIFESQQYIGQEVVLKSEYPQIELLGHVTKKLDDKEIKPEDIVANELEIGVQIYRLDSSTLVAEFNSENFKIFKLSTN